MASGGKLQGYGGGDRRLILAEDGESIVNKEATARNQALLTAVNGGRPVNSVQTPSTR